MILTPPVALTLSIIGLVRGGERGLAIAGVIISGAAVVMFFVLPLIMRLCV